MCKHTMTQLFDGQEFCVTCGEEIFDTNAGMTASGFFTPGNPDYVADDMDDDSPNFPDDDSLNPGGYDLGRLT